MTQWKYRLKSGLNLRQAIYDEDPKAILDALEKAWREIYAHFKFVDDLVDIAYDLEDINNERDNLDYLDCFGDYTMTYDDVIDNINSLLNNLYDFCDSMGIWIEI